MRRALIPLMLLAMLAACAQHKPLESASVATGLFIQSSLRAPRDWDAVARQIAQAYASGRVPTRQTRSAGKDASPPASAPSEPAVPVMVTVPSDASTFLSALGDLLAVRLAEAGLPVARAGAPNVRTLRLDARLVQQDGGSSVIVSGLIEQAGRQVFAWSRPYTISADDRLLYLPAVADKPAASKRLTVTGG
jgi:hypothetical protein